MDLLIFSDGLGGREASEGQRDFRPQVVTKRETPKQRVCEGGGGWQGHAGGSQGVTWRWEGPPRQDGLEDLSCMVAVVETDKGDCEERYKHDTTCFSHSPTAGSGELDRNMKCEGQVIGKNPPSIYLSFKKYLLRAPPGHWPVTFIYSEAGALGRGASPRPFPSGIR